CGCDHVLPVRSWPCFRFWHRVWISLPLEPSIHHLGAPTTGHASILFKTCFHVQIVTESLQGLPHFRPTPRLRHRIQPPRLETLSRIHNIDRIQKCFQEPPCPHGIFC